MDEILDATKSINNNLIESLDVLKENQKLEQQLSDITKQSDEKENYSENENLLKSEDLLKDENEITNQSENNDEIKCNVNSLMDNLLEKNNEEQIIHDNTQEITTDDLLENNMHNGVENNQVQFDEQNLVDLTTSGEMREREASNSCELIDSSEQLIDDSNNTSNIQLIDSRDENLMHDMSMEKARENFIDNQLIDDTLEDYSVKESEKLNNDLFTESLDSKQDSNVNAMMNTMSCDTSFSNQADDHSQEKSFEQNYLEKSLLDDSLENSKLIIDESNKTEDSIQLEESINLSNEVSNEMTNDSTSEPFESQQITDHNKSSEVDVAESSLMRDVTNVLNKSVDDFLSNVKPIQMTLNQPSMETFVNTDQVEKIGQTVDLLTKNETFIIHKPELSQEESKITQPIEHIVEQDEQDKQVIKESTEEINDNQAFINESNEKMNENQAFINESNEKINENQASINENEPISVSKSKSQNENDDVFTQSQKFFEKTDKLIAEKKNSIPSEFDIPGLDLTGPNTEQFNEQQQTVDAITDALASTNIIDQQTTGKSQESEANVNKQSDTNSESIRNAKVKKAESKKCIIS